MSNTPSSSNLDNLITDLIDLSDHGIQKGKEKGIDSIKIGLSAGKDKRLVMENMEYSSCNTLESSSIGIGVHHLQKKGSSSTNSPSQKSLESALSKAYELSTFGIEDPFLTLASKEQAPEAKELGFLYDPLLNEIPLSEIEESISEGLEEIKKDKRIALDRMEAGVSTSFHGTRNSNGVFQKEKQTTIYWSFLGMAKDGDAVSGMDYESGSSFTKAGYKEKLKEDLSTFKKRVLQNLNPVKCPTYKGLVLLTPRAVEQLLVSQILFHSSGAQIMDGKSKWGDKLDKLVTSNLLSISDFPHDPRLQGATAFDADGLPTKDKVLIENGTLKTHLFSCYSAKKLNKTPNGMAGGPFGLIVKGGESSLESLKNQRNEILLIDRFSGNSDPLTGDFSGVAKSSRLIKDGQEVASVTETMIAGNTFDLLSSIAGVSLETEMVSREYISPYILCDGVSVSGQ